MGENTGLSVLDLVTRVCTGGASLRLVNTMFVFLRLNFEIKRGCIESVTECENKN